MTDRIRSACSDLLAAGRLVLLRDTNPLAVVGAVREVRARGAIPLVGDQRWSRSYRQSVEKIVASIAPAAGAAWAALTSASSGEPRIVLRTHESWSKSFAPVATLLGAGSDDVLYLPSPPVSSLSLFSIAHAEVVK